MSLSRNLVALCVAVLLAAYSAPAWAQFTSDTDWGGADFIPANGATIAGTHTNVGLFHVAAGTTVYVEEWDGANFGSVVIDAQNILIEGDLVAVGAGYLGGLPTLGPTPGGDGLPGEGPGAGGGGERGNYVGSSGGGGAGYGGPGGVGGDGENAPGAGGVIYGDAMSISIEMGSGGGAGGAHAQPSFPSCMPGGHVGGLGGDGGGVITLNASVDLTISGAVSADGQNGFAPVPPACTSSMYGGGGGAGSGGGILINAVSGVVTGTLSARGGIGGDMGGTFQGIGGGGGGGGGRIKVIGSVNTVMAIIDVSGGAPGVNGTNATPPAAAGAQGTVYSFSSTDPVATPIPTVVDFGDVFVTATGGPVVLTLLNAGGANLVVSNITFAGDPEITIVGGLPGLPATLMPAQTLTLMLQYAPLNQGTHTATVTFDSNDPFFPTINVPVTGNGVLPGFSVTPTLLDFGGVQAGTVSSPMTFNITNNGTAPVDLLSTAVGGASAAEFSVLGLPVTPTSVGPGTTIPVTVTYLPADAGMDMATVTLTSNDPMNPTVVVDLQGEGVAGALTPMPPVIDFGGVPVGGASMPETVTVENTGTDDVTIMGASVSGTNAGSFVLSSAPGYPSLLIPGASEVFELIFTPTMVGAHSATLSITSDTPGMPMLNVQLLGEGLTAMLSVVPTSLDFGDVPVSTTSMPLVVTLSNTGAADVTVVSATLGGAAPGSFLHDFGGSLLVPAGTDAVVMVQFAPVATGLVAATLTFTSDSPAAPLITVGLVGRGVTGGGNPDGGVPGADGGLPPVGRGGCSCRVGSTRSPAAPALLLLGLLLGAAILRSRR